mmetsp:Transcript_10826/g.22911  ORF Transcript_10826/g.22911 Transcript_10826/m.22911 type:complete len:266 (-) Transcript_10826:68-865(-)|eukprot:CAMPEP_0171344592 /NCGR_PEP_ID=MMETSP0878-20121228/19740_1 /TAXON_ID=67004 /ORGANISM="Thalassiosira weissflogii, Strain CCMP1336" /LENGTH=265 /DNA_ID=CAMNT_0011847817 /DNA_START=26 /DNA_END=823 /DNA_ORIENTATION=+
MAASDYESKTTLKTSHTESSSSPQSQSPMESSPSSTVATLLTMPSNPSLFPEAESSRKRTLGLLLTLQDSIKRDREREDREFAALEANPDIEFHIGKMTGLTESQKSKERIRLIHMRTRLMIRKRHREFDERMKREAAERREKWKQVLKEARNKKKPAFQPLLWEKPTFPFGDDLYSAEATNKRAREEPSDDEGDDNYFEGGFFQKRKQQDNNWFNKQAVLSCHKKVLASLDRFAALHEQEQAQKRRKLELLKNEDSNENSVQQI